MSVPVTQTEELLRRLEICAASGAGAAAALLLDCACALTFILIGDWHHAEERRAAETQAAQAGDQPAASQPPNGEPASVLHLSRCISVLARLCGADGEVKEALDSEQPAAPQLAALLADWAPDIAAAVPMWRQLYGQAATAAGLGSPGDDAGSFTSVSDAVGGSGRIAPDVADKVRAFRACVGDPRLAAERH